jgi:hypothetical protein
MSLGGGFDIWRVIDARAVIVATSAGLLISPGLDRSRKSGAMTQCREVKC